MIRTGWLVILASSLHIGWGLSVMIHPTQYVVPGMLLVDHFTPTPVWRGIIYLLVGIIALGGLVVMRRHPALAFSIMTVQMALLLMALFGVALRWSDGSAMPESLPDVYIFRNQLALIVLVVGHIAVLTELIWTPRLSSLYRHLSRQLARRSSD